MSKASIIWYAFQFADFPLGGIRFGRIPQLASTTLSTGMNFSSGWKNAAQVARWGYAAVRRVRIFKVSDTRNMVYKGHAIRDKI